MKKESDKEELDGLASRLREMVEEIGTQSEAAAIAKIAPRQIPAYLSAKTCPNFLVVARLTAASGFNPYYVMTGKGPKRVEGQQIPDAMIVTPSNVPATLEARRTQLGPLQSLYTDAGWPLSDEEDGDLMVLDTLMGAMDFPPSFWEQAHELVATSHQAAIRHIKRALARRR